MTEYLFKDNPSKRASLLHAATLVKNGWNQATVRGNNNLRDLIESQGGLVDDLFTQGQDFSELKGMIGVLRSLNRANFDFDVITIADDNYPNRLKDIPGAPPVLYVMGSQELLEAEKGMAVVGTRELYDPIVIQDGKEIVSRLVQSDYVIVSGLAEGCDTLAHQTAIEKEGKTIAVLGTPLDIFYPVENRDLQTRIAQDHLLVSIYPIGLRTFPNYFAFRNRVTVGLANDGVTVIQAGEKSGTQHAMNDCDTQGKTLYVLNHNSDEKWFGKRKEKMGNKFKIVGAKNGQ